MLTKENLECMRTKNMQDISVYTEILKSKVSTLDTYRRGIHKIVGDHPSPRETYIQEDSKTLRDLLVSICHNGPKEETSKAAKGKINEMLDTVSSIAEGESSMSDWPGCYWSQYRDFLHDLRDLITTEVPLYQKSNLAIARKLAELAD